jgi:coenzyme F420-reducing hydrogenase delta subunit/Fe-S-cluster-containing hydrogenase component 2
MCSGRVDLEFILRAFSNGVDGVFIGGCRLNECNYITHGNYHALNLVLLSKKILQHIGLNPDRLSIGFMSAGEGMLFAKVVDEFVETVKTLGPLGAADGEDGNGLAGKLAEVTKLVPYIKIVKREKLASRLENQADRDDFFTSEEIDQLFTEVVSYHIEPTQCQACMICLRKCPVEAITGRKKQIHVINQDLCIKCGTCYDACPSRFGAVKQITGQPVPLPIPEAERTINAKHNKINDAP